MKKNAKSAARGSTAIEMALTLPLLVIIMLGIFMLGLTVIRGISVVQLTRDTGQMFARGLDFSLTGNREIVVRLAAGMGMQRTGGNGVVILSQIMYVGDEQCAAGGYPGSDCVNRNWPVIVRRIVIGNAALRTSNFGTPNPALIDSEGWVSRYLTEVSARATGFSSVIPDMTAGQIAYLVESYFYSPELALSPAGMGGGVYSRAVF